jgi:hypothetical protein
MSEEKGGAKDRYPFLGFRNLKESGDSTQDL